jgi:hypothetical protein
MSAERHAIPETHGPSSLWCRREWSGTVVVTLSCGELLCVSRRKVTHSYASTLPKILQFAMLQIVCLSCERRRYPAINGSLGVR